MLPIFIIIPLYAFLGGAIKFIDQAYDEQAFSIKTANLLAVICGVVMGVLMTFDSPFSTAFFIAMIISLILARKIDNIAFAIGTVTTIVVFALLYLREGAIIMLGPVAIFLVAGFIDEIVDGVAHKVRMWWPMEWFCHYRPFSDIALFMLVVAGTFDWVYIMPYFTFTFAYLTMEKFTPMELGSSIKGVLMRAVNLRP